MKRKFLILLALVLALALGASGAYAFGGYDNGVFADTTDLTSIGYFAEEDRIIEAEAGNMFDNDNYGNHYSRLIYAGTSEGMIEYRLDDNYTAFNTTLYVTGPATKDGHDHYWDTATISVYGDDVLMYRITGFTPKSAPQPINLNIEGVKFLKITFDHACYYRHGMEEPLVALGNPVLVK